MFFNDQDILMDTVDSNTTRKVLAHSDQLMYVKVMFAKSSNWGDPVA
ncbi:hypothetical protein [Paenibacillus sp. ICGEB2008]|nr:hypothetical protein [Paenibacillus sp. ICGEB2008]